jgi:hypothetical protein
MFFKSILLDNLILNIIYQNCLKQIDEFLNKNTIFLFFVGVLDGISTCDSCSHR